MTAEALVADILAHNPNWLTRGIIFLPTEWPHYPVEVCVPVAKVLYTLTRLAGRSIIFQVALISP